jgi:hypothetical protein
LLLLLHPVHASHACRVTRAARWCVCWWSAACKRPGTTPTMDTWRPGWLQCQRVTRCVTVTQPGIPRLLG